jgi:hypothetical protein
MTRRRRREPARKRTAPAPRGLPAWLWVTAGILLAVALAVVAPRLRSHRSTPPPDEAAALAPVDAYREATRLAREDRLRESLPYYRRAASTIVHDFWAIHFDYGVVLQGLALQYTHRGGRLVFATRSSAERALLAGEAMHQLDQAARLAPDPPTRSKVLRFRANMTSVWGFPWETLAGLRAAQMADSADHASAIRAVLYLQVMHEPDRYRAAEGGPESDDSLRARAARLARSGGARP